MQTCPDCGLINPEEALRCDCGFALAKHPPLQSGEPRRIRDVTVPVGIATIHALLSMLGVWVAHAEGSIRPLTPFSLAVIVGFLLLPAAWLYPFLRFAERRPTREAAGAALAVSSFALLCLFPLVPGPLLAPTLLTVHAAWLLIGHRYFKNEKLRRIALFVGLTELLVVLALMVWMFGSSST